MNKIVIFVFALFAFYGCEKDFDSVVKPDDNSYQVTAISAFTEFNYFPGDSTRPLVISFNSAANISNVRYDIFSPAGTKVNSAPINMSKSGQNSFSGTLIMSRNFTNGNYTLKYYVTDLSGNTREAALHKFVYNNGSTNFSPVIANALIEPDTVVVNQTTILTVTLEVSDADGLNDIELVYFIVYRPNGTTSGNQNILSDNGIQSDIAWDERAGDGVYSQKISVNETTEKGTWRFEFRARDRSKTYSNTISYNVVIQ
jgi:hypothetical protein